MNGNDFPMLKKDLVYFDNAATTFKPYRVINKMNEYYLDYNANSHRGDYDISFKVDDEIDYTRDLVKCFINARRKEEIIFTRNTTDSINTIVFGYFLNNLDSGDEIILSSSEHASNILPWLILSIKKNVKVVFVDSVNEKLNINDLVSKINSKTKVISLAQVTNVSGDVRDVKKIISIAHKYGILVVVDAAQSAPHMKIDVSDMDADFLAFSGHKMFAPLGIGILYGKRELLNKMNPFLMGGDMIEYVHEQKTTFAPLPNKFEAGTQNVEGVVGLGAAIDYINSIGYDKIQEHDRKIVEYAREKLSKLDYLDIYMTPNAKNHSAVISFNIKGVHPHDVASILDSENVCIRSGNHCAQPLMRFLGIDSTCRASFYIYNTKEDVDRLVAGIEKAYKMFEKYINR